MVCTPPLISENINYISVQALKSQTMVEVAKGLNLVKRKYEKRGFKVNRYHVESELDNPVIHDMAAPEILDIYANKEHVGFIERSIREIKERARETCQDLLYRRIQKIMVRELISGIIHMLNNFANENDLNRNVSLGTIVDARGKMDFAMKRINYGSSTYVYTETKNNMETRSVPAIALRPFN